MEYLECKKYQEAKEKGNMFICPLDPETESKFDGYFPKTAEDYWDIRRAVMEEIRKYFWCNGRCLKIQNELPTTKHLTGKFDCCWLSFYKGEAFGDGVSSIENMVDMAELYRALGAQARETLEDLMLLSINFEKKADLLLYGQES